LRRFFYFLRLDFEPCGPFRESADPFPITGTKSDSRIQAALRYTKGRTRIKNVFDSKATEAKEGNIHRPMQEISGTSGHWRERSASNKGAMIFGLAVLGIGVGVLIAYRRGMLPTLIKHAGLHGFKALANTAVMRIAEGLHQSNKLRRQTVRRIKKTVLRFVS
jgi:hypothetical protein